MSDFITREYVSNLLSEVSKQMGYPVPRIRFVCERTYLYIFKDVYIVQELLKLGVFESYMDYPSFVGMLGDDIVITLKRAKKLLKGFPEPKVREYLKYVIAHELVHINKNHTGTHDEEIEACEEAQKVTNMEIYEEVNRQVWGPTKRKAYIAVGKEPPPDLI
jgi:hypothetical protein